MSDLYLALDASTYRGTAAIVSRDGEVLAQTETAMRGVDEERLMPAVAQLLGEGNVRAENLAAVICGAGPGSFTSLRIAASIAKGMAMGLAIPLYAVPSLVLIPASVEPLLPAGEYMALLDAMRGDFHALACSVTRSGKILCADAALLLDGAAVAGIGGTGVHDIGAGRTIDASPHARGVARIIEGVIDSGPVDLNEWEPVYGRLAEAEVRLRSALAAPQS
jgi:tRNA threonylcarbamoyladenosine biosynthesis protein TsaB